MKVKCLNKERKPKHILNFFEFALYVFWAKRETKSIIKNKPGAKNKIMHTHSHSHTPANTFLSAPVCLYLCVWLINKSSVN